ncbi:BLUF domain-containing protein [Sphingomonas sp. SUN039]|uniref:BLUF domain-containing protein n=1 Tax=Sphingomonas sp. SUN039 TaxID=2937787 RepID=UPI002164CF65|nr:BLUF domain-containing protein [Sphingomonas sp. SUN039]UVO52886.1 BLUF domain-containing protein [Sphingomonas sp. SUN039]
MTIHQLIYMSEPFGFDDGILNGILSISRRNNPRDGVTGALIVRRDIYLQLLEGPEAAVEAAFGRISGDDRHLAVHRLCSGAVAARLFPDWAMRDDPARSWLWSEAQVGAGAVQAASATEVRGVFERVARETV